MAVDVIEIDAATNRGIDEIRELREAARYAPARDRYKIYILDEAHQITEAAFNALLKTLEEPPAHVIFMMATTEPENIPQTIRSRCQHFSFHAVRFDDILAQLRIIAEKEDVQAEEAALALLAEAGDGSMRDALSIMDQAIASARVENGRPILSALQIRELTGSVPNAVFERLLDAVSAGQSAELMEQLNTLLNAGHSPYSLARQMVRYLRNTLMARLGGEKTELLQISGDERARAARSAQLFTEEEITRNLQIMLTTFDALNETQEHRFHLELGMLKMVHAQRLLPIEQLLSGVASGAAVRSGAQTAGSRMSPVAARPPSPASGSTASSFGSTAIPGTMQNTPTASVAEIEAPNSVLRSSAVADPAPSEDMQISEVFESATSTEPVKLPSSAPQITEAPSIETLRLAVISALADAGHPSAAQLLGAGSWSVDGSSLRIAVTGISKKMLSLTVNAAAEKIMRQELQRLAAPARFLIVPGDSAGGTAASAPLPVAGSIQETALNNPLVQKAREIFKAEVRSIVDLRIR
jgi:DNA polymerase-3 subunit gamma/tau